MRTYEYKGYTVSGARTEGFVEAWNAKDARAHLAEKGVLAESVWSHNSGMSSRRTGCPAGVRAAFYREAAALLQAGIPLVDAIETLLDAPELATGRRVFSATRDSVREGLSFAAALRSAGAGLRPFEEAAIESGERTGSLGTCLEELAEALEHQLRLAERVKTALLYPTVVLTLSLLAGLFMLGVLLPSFARLLEDVQIEVPALTRGLLLLGRWFWKAILPALLICALTTWLVLRRMRSREEGRVRLDLFLLRLPLVGQSVRWLAALRFARTLGMLLQQGNPMLDTLPLAARATGRASVEKAMVGVQEKVRSGEALSLALTSVPLLADELSGWIYAGENSGELPSLLSAAATRLEARWERRTARLLALLEPVLVVCVGVLVFLLALAILLPVLALNQSLGM